MNNPLTKLADWLEAERALGNVFPHGAVLSTIGIDGFPHSRMLGVIFDQEGIPRFHTSPSTRKVQDISYQNNVSLTFAFQQSLRSVNIEGNLISIPSNELEADWLKLSQDFRRNYLVFGHQSTFPIDSLDELRKQRDKISSLQENIMPSSFIGYKFEVIKRASFYTVVMDDFAIHEIYIFDFTNETWTKSLRIP